MYEFETKSLLKIIFITFVIWNNCFLLQNDFFPLAHSLWQQKRCKGFSIKDSECWIFRENCKYCQKRLKCIIFHNFNSLLLPSKESRIRLLIPKCCAYNFISLVLVFNLKPVWISLFIVSVDNNEFLTNKCLIKLIWIVLNQGKILFDCFQISTLFNVGSVWYSKAHSPQFWILFRKL